MINFFLIRYQALHLLLALTKYKQRETLETVYELIHIKHSLVLVQQKNYKIQPTFF